MCGIVGLFAKNKAIEQQLGDLLSTMLIEMTDRGPDSAGVAIYRAPVADGCGKVVLQHPDEDYDWHGLAERASADWREANIEQRGNHAVLRFDGSIDGARKLAETVMRGALNPIMWVRFLHPEPFYEASHLYTRNGSVDDDKVVSVPQQCLGLV